MKKTIYALLIVVICSFLLVTPVAAQNWTERFIVLSCFRSVNKGGITDVAGHVCLLWVDASLRTDIGHWWGTGVFIDASGRLMAVLNITVGEQQGEHGSWILSGGYGDENGPHGGGATVWLNNVKIAENIVFGLQLDTVGRSYYLELYGPVDRAYRWNNYFGQIIHQVV
jgi:hypothetical protein